ncbi:hypothetical protein PCCS19_21900 [Paenibacillus sp. CCS19]|uniref:hypothetical protein n=1 Tax=Paenibacillus sp. CCS19 TaxID=3158387 RepID=UPI00255E06CA|nr:hypothetical protein [Paenibacillus cellulosilyticus]GMK39136.1 hypothetical protein PCCS19_21900 [Paenibacillus cellulosilyticus]
MKFDQNAKLGDLLGNEAAKAVLDKHLPGFSTNPMTGMASGFTLSQLAAFPQANINAEVLASIVSDLAAIE